MPRPTDPYAPPPRHKDSSGVLVRVVIVAALLGLTALGYTYYSQQVEQTAELGAGEQQMADGGQAVSPADSDFAPSAAAPSTGDPAPAPTPPEAPPSTGPVPPPAEPPATTPPAN